MVGYVPGAVDDVTEGRTEQHPFVDRVLLFTDVEGSSRRWDAEPHAMRGLMRHHDACVSTVVDRFGGVLGARTGDGAIALFHSAESAARAALELQALVLDGPEATAVAADPLRVRVGLHRGVVEHRDGEHYGPPMHRAARVMAAGHGGQILVSAVVADELRAASSVGPSAETFTIVDRGIHRLKGFAEPERLSELRRRDAPVDVRALRGVATIGNLPPIDLEAFVGRDAEVSRLLPALRAGRLVTLVGTGGVGKTRLALQLAALAQDRFHDGVWFVDLASVTSADRVPTAVAATIGVSEDSSQPLLASLRQAFHGREMLVVLDNCEHVYESVVALLRAVCSDRMPTSVLSTSQRGLGVAGERIESISPLFCDVADGTAGHGSPAAEMFVLVAKRSGATLTSDALDAAAVERICRRLEGLPLALELAAARVRVMSVAEIADRLETSFELLRSRDRAARHRTMSAAISWSLDLLSAEDRSLLLLLSVFAGDITLEGAAAVSGLDVIDVADSLEELTRRSLLVQRGAGLRMLRPLRLFCSAALAAEGREPEARARHAAWVLDSLPDPFDDADPEVVGARLDRVMHAADDIDAAHGWLVAHRIEDAIRMSVLLADAYMARARYSVALDRFLACDTDTTPPVLRVEVLGWVAAFEWMVGRYDDGDAAARRALAMAHEHGLPLPRMAAVLRCAYSAPEEAAELAAAIEREIRESVGEVRRADIARHFPPLGMVFAVIGEPEHGTRLADEGVAEARRVGAVLYLNSLGNRIMIHPSSDAVAGMMAEVVELARTLGRKVTLAQAYVALAHRARRAGDIGGFLTGVLQMADLLLDDEPQSVVQMLHWVPHAVLGRFPREAALMTASLGTLAEKEHYIGAAKEQARRATLRAQLAVQLGDGELERAWAEGARLDVRQLLDRLRWMAGEYAA